VFIFQVARWFGFANFIIEKKISAIRCAIHRNEVYTGIFKFWVFTFWNLSPKIKCRVALTKVFLSQIFLVSFISTADKFVTNG